MILILKPDLDIVKMYFHTKNASSQQLQHGQTHSQTDTQIWLKLTPSGGMLKRPLASFAFIQFTHYEKFVCVPNIWHAARCIMKGPSPMSMQLCWCLWHEMSPSFIRSLDTCAESLGENLTLWDTKYGDLSSKMWNTISSFSRSGISGSFHQIWQR